MVKRRNLQRVAAGSAAVGLAGLLLALAWLALTPRAVQAAGVVTTCDEAHVAAALAGGGSVTFNCGGPVIISFTTSILITQNTSIDGGSLSLVTLSGSFTTTIFETASGVQLNLSHLAFINGSNAGPGGALVLDGPTTISDSRFEKNWANVGGAIHADRALTITNSTFRDNEASTRGGAINANESLWVTGSLFDHNTAEHNEGGALSTDGTAVWITNSVFTRNFADDEGGALALTGPGHVVGSLFHDNESNMYGGAVNNTGELWLSSSEFYSNTAGIYGGGLSNYGRLHLSTSRFYHNHADASGGGVATETDGEISDTVIYSNTATYGGGLSGYTLVTVTRTSVYDNVADRRGGGIYLTNSATGTVALTDVDVHHNSVKGLDQPGTGGGLAIEMFGYPVTLTRLTVHDNTILSTTTSWGGAGIAVLSYGPVLLQDSSVYGNVTSDGSGGGLYATDGAYLIVKTSAIYSNTASQVGVGGGIYVQYIGIADPSALFLENSTVSSNFAVNGAGIFNDANNEPAVINAATLFNNNGVTGINLQGEAILHGTAIGQPQVACAADGNVACAAGSGLVTGPFGQNCVGAISSQGYNLDDDGTCSLTATGDFSNTEALLGPLMWNGGLSLTHAPLPGSVLIDGGDPITCPATDQRGGARAVDGDGVGGPRCDIGAVEVGAFVFWIRVPLILR